MDKMSEQLDPAVVAKAMKLQARADRITRFRGEKAKYLGAAIGATERSWGTTAVAAAFVATDWLDGFLAKRAQKMLGVKKPLTDGAVEDPRRDKQLRNALMSGITVRAALEGDKETLIVVAGVGEASDRRDGRMAASREVAEKYDLAVGVGAIQKNRIKTAAEMTSLLVHISPLANRHAVRRGALTGLAAGTAVGLSGERDYTGIVNDQLAERWTSCPDRILTFEEATTDVPAYTTPEPAPVIPLFEAPSAAPPELRRVEPHS